MFSLLCFLGSSFLLIWIYYSVFLALIISVVLGIFLYLFLVNGYDIISSLYIPDGEAETSQFTNFK